MSSSSLETFVASWLDREGITYRREARVWFRRVDFLLEDDTIIQVQGCYWHGCWRCTEGKPPKKFQKRARKRDKAFRTYCHRKGKRLFEVWEHDLKAGDLTTLMDATARLRRARARRV